MTKPTILRRRPLRPPLPSITFKHGSCKFEVSSPCSHGDMSQNVPGSPVIKMCSKRNNIATYVARGSPYTRRLCKVRGHAHKVKEPDDGQKVGKKAAAGVSMKKNEKISVSIDI